MAVAVEGGYGRRSSVTSEGYWRRQCAPGSRPSISRWVPLGRSWSRKATGLLRAEWRHCCSRHSSGPSRSASPDADTAPRTATRPQSWQHSKLGLHLKCVQSAKWTPSTMFLSAISDISHTLSRLLLTDIWFSEWNVLQLHYIPSFFIYLIFSLLRYFICFSFNYFFVYFSSSLFLFLHSSFSFLLIYYLYSILPRLNLWRYWLRSRAEWKVSDETSMWAVLRRS